MRRNLLPGWNNTRLRLALALFFLALAVPTTILVRQAYSQLKWESFHHHRVQAEELVSRIDRRYGELIGRESARSFTDYAFLNVAGSPGAGFLQRSPLSGYPVSSVLPGVVGYFQVDPEGRFSTPLLPADVGQAKRYGISETEYAQRSALQDRIYGVLSQHQLVGEPPFRDEGSFAGLKPEPEAELKEAPTEPRPPGPLAGGGSGYRQAAPKTRGAFDRLQAESVIGDKLYTAPRQQSLGRVEDLKLEDRYQHRTDEDEVRETGIKLKQSLPGKRALRKEQNILPSLGIAAGIDQGPEQDRAGALRVNMFESEIDAFEFNILDSGHFVLYRKVWRDGERYIQGVLIDAVPFLEGGVKQAFYDTSLSRTSRLAVAWQGNVLYALDSRATRGYLRSARELGGALLLNERLSNPLGYMGLIFSVGQLPAGPGGTVITWLAVILLVVLSAGLFLTYRLGVKQIKLNRQQQDFVSAVSHELKTPLTSIRMYGEMLREGWAPQEKRNSYYEYIHDESERLTRLINNVLQLARMTRNEFRVELSDCPVSQLMDTIRSKIVPQAERAGFVVNIDCDEGILDQVIRLDPDCFTQIFINLLDNAIKFSISTEAKQIDIGCHLLRDGRVQFSIRDYGPGIPKKHLRKIFRLFYREENELTRETVGTGIGLALVQQLTRVMQGKVDVINRDPGAEFHVVFRSASRSDA